MEHTVRPVRAEEWSQAKDMRLDALRDPVAHLAFLETYEQAAAQPDSFWQNRAARAGEGKHARQFVAERPDGHWLGTLTVLIEASGVEGPFGDVPEAPQAHFVGVFVRPGARGSGIAQDLFRAGADWAWAVSDPRVTRVRLYVHEDNTRAHSMYRKAGFAHTGTAIPVPGNNGQREYELALPRP